MAGGFDAGGEVALQFAPHDGIKCYAIVSGQCWLAMQGVAEPVLMQTGDCFLLPRGRGFTMASDLSLPPVDAMSVIKTPLNGRMITFNGGGSCLMVGGHFALEGAHAGFLLAMLPPIVHVRKEADKAALRWSMDQMRRELREPQPGGALVAQHLAQLMLVQALRAHLADAAGGGVGWLFALADPQMSRVIDAMHGDPAQRWTLQSLAERAGMSRSTFALRFRETVGASPMEYLSRWRMLLAGDRLAHSREPVSAIALSLGYESESAFSTAFKRVMGCSPRQYGRRQLAPTSAAQTEPPQPDWTEAA
jgi:AraC-like DNA-binding protein